MPTLLSNTGNWEFLHNNHVFGDSQKVHAKMKCKKYNYLYIFKRDSQIFTPVKLRTLIRKSASSSHACHVTRPWNALWMCDGCSEVLFVDSSYGV